MALTFGFYLDSACTTPIVSTVQFVQAITAPTPLDKCIYFGSPKAGRYAKPAGGGQIVVALSGPAAGDMALALSSAGLAPAVPGASLELGLQVDGGPDGVVPLFVRALDSSGVSGQRPFALMTNTLEEWQP